MTNEFTYRFTDCKSCRYNWETGTECGKQIDCSACSNHTDNAGFTHCKCFEQATDAKICPYYKENK